MTIATDQPLSKLVFYSSGGVLCPEAFVKLTIPPGDSRVDHELQVRGGQTLKSDAAVH